MKVTARLFLAAMLLALCLPLLAEAAVPQNQNDLEKQIRAEEQQLKKITSQIAAGNKKLQAAKEKEKKAINEINVLANKLAEAEQRLNVTVLKRNQIQAKLSETLRPHGRGVQIRRRGGVQRVYVGDGRAGRAFDFVSSCQDG